jgi:hypothetical protein
VKIFVLLMRFAMAASLPLKSASAQEPGPVSAKWRADQLPRLWLSPRVILCDAFED